MVKALGPGNFKKRLIRLFAVSLLLLSSIIGLLPQSSFAASASLYLAPAVKTVVKGSNLSLAVRVNTGGQNANAVQANLAYPADKFDFVGISTAGSAFDVGAQASGGDGAVQISRGSTGPVNGDKLVATVTLRAKVNSGTGAVSFSDGSSVASDGNYLSTTTSGGNYTFSNPAPAPAPTPAAPADTTTPKITDVKITNITLNSATITWHTDEPANSVVEFGLSSGYGASVSSTQNVTDHAVALTSALIVPGVTYHLRAVSTDAAGNTAHSDDMTFRTNGFAVNVVVVNSKKKPLDKVQVTISDQQAKTNNAGVAGFKDVAPGRQLVTATARGKVASIHVEIAVVDLAAQPEPQVVQLTLDPPPAYTLWILLGLLLLLLLGGGGGYWFWQRRHPGASPAGLLALKRLRPFKSKKKLTNSPDDSLEQTGRLEPSPPPPPEKVFPPDSSNENHQ